MRIRDWLRFSADFMSPGAAHAPTARHHAVMSPHMKKTGGHTRPSVGKEHVGHSPKTTMSIRHPHGGHVRYPTFKADASASDLASHHTWQEPSASDLTIRNWRAKRLIERTKRRNLEPFEEGARMLAAGETGPCGCTLKLGDRVTVDDVGRGHIKERDERMLRVKLDSGKYRTVDQKFVHKML